MGRRCPSVGALTLWTTQSIAVAPVTRTVLEAMQDFVSVFALSYSTEAIFGILSESLEVRYVYSRHMQTLYSCVRNKRYTWIYECNFYCTVITDMFRPFRWGAIFRVVRTRMQIQF